MTKKLSMKNFKITFNAAGIFFGSKIPGRAKAAFFFSVRLINRERGRDAEIAIPSAPFSRRIR